MTDTTREARDMRDDDLLAQINGHDPYDVEFARRYRALLARIRKLEAENAALRGGQGMTVKPLGWHKSHINGWNGDWHTVPTAYTVRCADENGWKWAGQSGFGYCHSDTAAKAAAQADHERRILSAISPAPVSVGEAAKDKAAWAVAKEVYNQSEGFWEPSIQQSYRIFEAALRALADKGEGGAASNNETTAERLGGVTT